MSSIIDVGIWVVGIAAIAAAIWSSYQWPKYGKRVGITLVILYLLFLTRPGMALVSFVFAEPFKTHGSAPHVSSSAAFGVAEESDMPDENTLVVRYGQAPFKNGARPIPTQSFPRYQIVQKGENLPVFSGLDCTLCYGGKISVSFPQSDDGLRKRLKIGSDYDWVELTRTTRTYSIDSDDELLCIQGIGNLGDVHTPTLQIELPQDVVVTRAVWEVTGKERLTWGAIPYPPSGMQWTLSIRFTRPGGVSFPPEVLSTAAAAYFLWAADGERPLHSERLAQEETRRTSQVVKEDAVLEILPPALGEPVEVRVVLRVEPRSDVL